MSDTSTVSGFTRRDLFRRTARFAGAAVALNGWPRLAGAAFASPFEVPQQASSDAVEAMRKQMGAIPIASTPLTDQLTMLSGPGGNVVVLNGPDGKVVVDTFFRNVWDKLRPLLDGMGNAPMKMAIDTHWHLDHSDGNENFRAAGADVLAHENTTKRLGEAHDLLGMHFDARPAAAMPTKTFKTTEQLDVNGEQVHLGYAPPAHTDTDIYIHFTKGNVLHMGDLFFNGSYPFIDTSTGGNIAGMIVAADSMLTLVDDKTKIVPGHGPLGDKAALTRYRDVMVTVRDRVQTLKTSGQSLEQAIAKKPTAELDEQWGKGFVQPDLFVTIVYNSL
jgi:glyoxylase-like metal-dependent hydrolase (beta-lactamase superfamily II)